MKFKNNNIAFVTGGLGFIGINLSNKLLEKKIVNKVIIFDNFSNYKFNQEERAYSINEKIIIERGSVDNYLLISRLILKYKPRFIYHLANIPLAKIDNLTTQESSLGTILGTTNIIECINELKTNQCYDCDRFIYISSSMVYGNFQSSKVIENSITAPIDIYGTTKLAGEVITKGLATNYNINFTIVRPSAVYGPGDRNSRVVKNFIYKAMKNEPINVNGKKEKLDFTFIDDLIHGLILIAKNKNSINQIFNLTYGASKTLEELIQILKKFFPNLKCVYSKKDSNRPSRGTLSISKARKLLKYNPKVSLTQGVEKYINIINQKKIKK